MDTRMEKMNAILKCIVEEYGNVLECKRLGKMMDAHVFIIRLKMKELDKLLLGGCD